jgi:glycerate kinase
MRVLLCPDSFKGSLSAEAVARAMAVGVRRVNPNAGIDLIPMADGGEGTARLLTRALAGDWRRDWVRGANGAAVCAEWGWLAATKKAVLDVASVCGLQQIAPDQRDVWQLDTRGLGELVRAALDLGAKTLLIGLGGSGTNDAGAGLLFALGAVFLDGQNHPLLPTPAGLAGLHHVDLTGLDARLAEVDCVVLADVTNPLVGSSGASAVFGPQKGLAACDIAPMDARLALIAQKMAAARPLFASPDAPGMGAAGGLGFALCAVLGGKLNEGSRYLAELLGLDAAIARADLVLTGEGALDSQTARGKVVAEVARRAGGMMTPVICIAGRVLSSPEQIAEMGLWGAWGLCTQAVGVDEAMSRADSLIAERTAQALRAWQAVTHAT